MPAMVDARCISSRTEVSPEKDAGRQAKALQKASLARGSLSAAELPAKLKFENLHMISWDWGILALKDVRK